MREDYFVELMSLVQNCETVILSSVTFVSSKEIQKVDIKFQRLHKLSLNGVKNCAILDAVYTTKSIRKLTIRYNSTDWSTFEKIMLRQKNLKSLKVWHNRIEGFKNSPEKWKSIQVEKLLVLDNRFGNKEDFESICAFLKTQKKVQNLQIEGFEGYDNENLLKETILGLLHLDTLRFLGSCPIEPSWRIHNPNVTTSLNEMGFLGFPNLTMLKYHRPLTPEILSQINSLQRLTVLNIKSATPQLLELMKIKELKKLHFFLGIKGEFTEETWKVFSKNQPQIESITLDLGCQFLDNFRWIITNLPNLKDIKTSESGFKGNFVEFEGFLDFIARNCLNMQSLTIHIDPRIVEFLTPEKIIEISQKAIPFMNCRLINYFSQRKLKLTRKI
jgi:hypothetical protein